VLRRLRFEAESMQQSLLSIRSPLQDEGLIMTNEMFLFDKFILIFFIPSLHRYRCLDTDYADCADKCPCITVDRLTFDESPAGDFDFGKLKLS
jgi:hypothetical protein